MQGERMETGFRQALLAAVGIGGRYGDRRGGFFGQAEKGFPPRTFDIKAKNQAPARLAGRKARRALSILEFFSAGYARLPIDTQSKLYDLAIAGYWVLMGVFLG